MNTINNAAKKQVVSPLFGKEATNGTIQSLTVKTAALTTHSPVGRILRVTDMATPSDVLDAASLLLDLAKDTSDQLANNLADGESDIPSAHYTPGCLVDLAKGLINTLQEC